MFEDLLESDVLFSVCCIFFQVDEVIIGCLLVFKFVVSILDSSRERKIERYYFLGGSSLLLFGGQNVFFKSVQLFKFKNDLYREC